MTDWVGLLNPNAGYFRVAGLSYLGNPHNVATTRAIYQLVFTQLSATGTARELAEELVPHLEAVANLHYLLDSHVNNPTRLKALRSIEDEAFSNMLDLILSHLPKPRHRSEIKMD